MRELKITSSRIEVSSNNLNETGYTVRHLVRGILPGCRKVAILHVSPSTGSIWVTNLYSHNGEAHIRPDHWAELIKATPVVSDKLDSFKVELTPEIIADAYRDVMNITVCPAVTSRKNVHPNFDPTFDPMVIDPAIMGVPSCR
jgi:hypothetical protein